MSPAILMFMSIKVTRLDRGEKVHDNPPLLIAVLNRVQLFLSVLGLGWCNHIPSPSSINLRRKNREVWRNGSMSVASWMATNKLAIGGAGAIPIAIPAICFTRISPNFILLLYITISRAEIRAPGE